MIVFVSFRDEVLPSMFIFQYTSAFSDRLDNRLFVLIRRLNWHDVLTLVTGRNILTACSGWLGRCVHSGGRGAALLQTYGQKTDMLFFSMNSKADYQFRLTRMFLRLRYSISAGYNSQNVIVPVVYPC